MKFDGKAFAKTIEDEIVVKVSKMVVKPKIVSVLVGYDPASALYTKLKEQAAERIGIQFEVIKLDTDTRFEEIDSRIRELGVREDVTGVMVQLPIPGLQGQTLKEVLEAIPLSKDVDGLRYPESGIVPPVVKAIMMILDQIAGTKSSERSPKIAQGSELWGGRFVVVGASGFVGSALCGELGKQGVEVIKVESDTQDPTKTLLVGNVVISCVGKEAVVTGEMVKDGVIAIDVGAPMGDMTREVYQKASVSVEVPGGVGPVTIACLMANAVDLVL